MDDGNYECIVENPVGIETSNSARLYVKGKGNTLWIVLCLNVN